jgi:hypothetical protein
MKPRAKKTPKTSPTKPAATPNRRDQILADFTTLRIPVTADQLDAALKHAQDAGLSHLDFLHRLLADQAGLRRQRRIERLIKQARFREALPLSTFDWSFNPTIPRLQIEALAQGDFIRRNQNVVFVGQSGLGKSRLIQSIGLAACMLEHTVYYITSGELLEDLTAAMADQTIHNRVRFTPASRCSSSTSSASIASNAVSVRRQRACGTRSSTPAVRNAPRLWSPTSTSRPGPTTSAMLRWRWPCWTA